MDVHVRDLRYFLAVADELHFTRAAQRLFVSQPALSKQIRGLEAHLRATLFVRGPGGVTLTAAGRALVPHARAVVATWDAGRSAVAEAVAAETRVLVLGLSVSVGRGLLPAVTEAFLERRPDWRLELHQTRFGDPTVGLADGSSDVGFCWLPLPEGAPLRVQVLFTEPRLVALPTGHRLTARAELTMDDLLDEPFLALRSPPARCAASGWARTPATGTGRAWPPSSTDPRRSSRHWAGASAWPSSPQATPRSTGGPSTWCAPCGA